MCAVLWTDASEIEDAQIIKQFVPRHCDFLDYLLQSSAHQERRFSKIPKNQVDNSL